MKKLLVVLLLIILLATFGGCTKSQHSVWNAFVDICHKEEPYETPFVIEEKEIASQV